MLAPALREHYAGDPITQEAQAKGQIRMVPTDEKSLGGALFSYAEMETCLLPRPMWTAFGWWMLERLPIERWDVERARRGWAAWMRKLDAGSDEVPQEARDAAHALAFKRLLQQAAQAREAAERGEEEDAS